MDTETKSRWDKADIILKPIGGLLTAVSVALVGIFGSGYLAERQEAETDARLFAELMTNRERADTTLRKDMLDSIIGRFLASHGLIDEDVLALELLAYNFHDTLDLGPLFKHVDREIGRLPRATAAEKAAAAAYGRRLLKVAQEVIAKQAETLREGGEARDSVIDFEELAKHPEGIQLPEFEAKPERADSAPDSHAPKRVIQVTVLAVSHKRSEVKVRLVATLDGQPEVDQWFWVGFFDFPMIDNTRLSRAQRCAIVLTDYDRDAAARVTLLYFAGSRASLKDRPYYEEVVHGLRTSQLDTTAD